MSILIIDGNEGLSSILQNARGAPKKIDKPSIEIQIIEDKFII